MKAVTGSSNTKLIKLVLCTLIEFCQKSTTYDANFVKRQLISYKVVRVGMVWISCYVNIYRLLLTLSATNIRITFGWHLRLEFSHRFFPYSYKVSCESIDVKSKFDSESGILHLSDSISNISLLLLRTLFQLPSLMASETENIFWKQICSSKKGGVSCKV